uniref:Carboxylic ester hydrolase n=1 Tax=Culicoides sonorensis TaxID=179676 RepID=A0A336KGN9_CULSO
MDPIIQTSYGLVKGLQKQNFYNKSYYAFYAIPYAQQPTGEHRFSDARPLEPWTGTLDATKVGDASWNFDRLNPNPADKKIIGSDNCLHLNVYLPELNPSEKLPVMVYIHGGRFATMSGTPFYYGPDYLIENGVILVTLNYRLGAFGFLSFKDPSIKIPGNAGLKDQLMALKWIKSEIEKFGGDTENITVFGESAGGCSVHYHLLSEQSRGLFHRAIIMSGSAFGPWSCLPNGDYAYRLAKAFGYEGVPENERDILNVILNADPKEIVIKQEELLKDEEKRIGQFYVFAPLIEPYVNEKTFVRDHPFKLSKTAWGNDIEVIVGGCSKEGLFFYRLVTPETMSSLGNFSNTVAQNVHLHPDTKNCIEKGLKLKSFYYGEEEPSLANSDIFIDIQSDKMFWHGMWMTMKARKNSKTFLYRFDVEPTSNLTIRELYQIPHQRGACHVEDVFYVFKAQYLNAPIKDSAEYKVVEIMTRTFTDFARYGNPSSQVLGDVKWESVAKTDDDTQIKCLNITGQGVDFKKFPEIDRMMLWDEICENDF